MVANLPSRSPRGVSMKAFPAGQMRKLQSGPRKFAKQSHWLSALQSPLPLQSLAHLALVSVTKPKTTIAESTTAFILKLRRLQNCPASELRYHWFAPQCSGLEKTPSECGEKDGFTIFFYRHASVRRIATKPTSDLRTCRVHHCCVNPPCEITSN